MKLSDRLVEEFRQGGLWVVAFVGVCVLVYAGKLKPETVEYILFALLGQAGMRKMATPQMTPQEPSVADTKEEQK
jgi:hypothetical protein